MSRLSGSGQHKNTERVAVGNIEPDCAQAKDKATRDNWASNKMWSSPFQLVFAAKKAQGWQPGALLPASRFPLAAINGRSPVAACLYTEAQALKSHVPCGKSLHHQTSAFAVWVGC